MTRSKNRPERALRPEAASSAPSVAACLLLILVTWSALFAVRATAPPSINDDDQDKAIAYVMDAVVNGNWIVQRDDTGDITSKPPLYTWACAVPMALTGYHGLAFPYLVNGLATLGTLLLIFFGARRPLGNLTALVAAITYQVSMMGGRQLLLIRTDSLLTFETLAMILLILAAMRGKTSWIWFWFVAALSALTKGPVGVLIASFAIPGALLAGRDKDERWHFPLVQNAAGLGLFLFITGGWFLLAWLVEGQALIDKMIGKELVNHAKGTTGNPTWWKPTVYFLQQFAPWSLLTFPALGWAIWKGRSTPAGRLALPLATAFALGLVMFSLANHQRQSLYMPLTPLAAVIGAPLLVAALSIRPTRGWTAGWVAVLLLAIAGFTGYYHVARRYDQDVQRTLDAQSFGAALKGAGISANDLTFVDVPYATQFFLGRMQPRVSPTLAAQALEAREPFLAVVKGPNADLVAETGAKVLLSWPPPPSAGDGFIGRSLAGILPHSDSNKVIMVIGNDQSKSDRRVIYPPHAITVSDATIENIASGRLIVMPTGEVRPRVLVKSLSTSSTDYSVWSMTGGSARIEVPPGERRLIIPDTR
ncbi:hypothetical protein GC173_11885 [bacterium]|nr:hypothetical protein [bacterium]